MKKLAKKILQISIINKIIRHRLFKKYGIAGVIFFAVKGIATLLIGYFIIK